MNACTIIQEVPNGNTSVCTCAQIYRHIIFLMDTGACRETKQHAVDFEKWSLAATSWKSHPVQSNLDVTRNGLSLLPSD